MHKLIVVAAMLFTTQALADPIGGTFRDRDSLAPRQNNIYSGIFVADEVTRIVVRGDGDGDIDCLVLDGNGNDVGHDVSSYDGCSIDINPRWTGVFNVKLQNNGNQLSFYSIRIF